jgi:hypothetical protein
MSLFSYIFQKLTKNKTNNYNIIIFNFHYSIKFLKNNDKFQKFKVFDKQIINNRLLNKNDKEELLNIFQQTQKIYFSFLKLYNLYKIKHLPFANNNFDLNLNPLCELSDNIKITFYQNNLKYNFRISDLINIINQSICYMDNFIFSVQNIKNPYTNIPFSTSILYTIYFKIKASQFIMPTFFHLYFLSNFDKEKFYKQNETLIKRFTLNNYIKNLTFNEKKNIIKEMLNEFKNGIYVLYDENIDNHPQKLVEMFQTCIKDYIFMLHSNNLISIYESKENLKAKMLFISQKNSYNPGYLKFKIKKDFKLILDNYNSPLFGNIMNQFINSYNLINQNIEKPDYKYLKFIFKLSFISFRLYMYFKFCYTLHYYFFIS